MLVFLCELLEHPSLDGLRTNQRLVCERGSRQDIDARGIHFSDKNPLPDTWIGICATRMGEMQSWLSRNMLFSVRFPRHGPVGPRASTFHRDAELHRKSNSPNGMFDFQVTTCDGKLPHTVAWEKRWAILWKAPSGRSQARHRGEWDMARARSCG